MDPKKTFIVVPVARPDSIVEYANDLEQALNAVSEHGYNPGVVQVGECGILIVGQTRPQPQQPTLVAIPRPRDIPHGVPPHVHEFLTEILKGLDEPNVPGLKRELPTIVRRMLGRIAASDIASFAADVTAAANEHAQVHDDPECEVPEMLRLLAAALREGVKEYVQ